MNALAERVVALENEVKDKVQERLKGLRRSHPDDFAAATGIVALKHIAELQVLARQQASAIIMCSENLEALRKSHDLLADQIVKFFSMSK